MKYTNPTEVLTLAKVIGTDMQDIMQLCNGLHRDLNVLQESFFDDQIQEIENALLKIEGLVTNSLEPIKILLNELVEYANALKELKRY